MLSFAHELVDNRVVRLTEQQLLSPHLLVLGQTGSGKSTTVATILRNLQKNEWPAFVFDPTGEYRELAQDHVFTLAAGLYLDYSRLTACQLLAILDLSWPVDLVARLDQAIVSLRIQKEVVQEPGIYRKINRSFNDYQQDLAHLVVAGSSYDLADLPEQLLAEFVLPYEDDQANFDLLGQRVDQVGIMNHWPAIVQLKTILTSPLIGQLFGLRTSPAVGAQIEIGYLLSLYEQHRSEQTVVIRLDQCQQYNQVALLSLLFERLVQNRLTAAQRFPLVISIDEAHRYLSQEGPELATNGIFKLAREGRKLGLHLILATQSPLDLPVRLRGQFTSQIVHYLSDPSEISQLGLEPSKQKKLPMLAVGQALLRLPQRQSWVQINFEK